MISPIDFAYQHFGRHVAPESRLAWLKHYGRLLKASKSKKAGDRSNAMAGTSIFIAESGVKVFGPDYRDQGFAAFGESGQAVEFAYRKLFAPISEPWLMVIFGKADVPVTLLHVNVPGDSKTAVYHGGDKELMQANPLVLARIAQPFLDAGYTSGKKVAEALHLQREYMAGMLQDEKSAARLKKLTTIRESLPKLPACSRLLLDSNMPPHYVGKFIDFQRQGSTPALTQEVA